MSTKMARHTWRTTAGLMAVLFFGLGWSLSGCQPSARTDSDDRTPDADTPGGRLVVQIEGMTCEACVSTITAAIKGLPGVETVDVSLAQEQAVVTGDAAKITEEAVVAAIEKAGYTVPPAAASQGGGPSAGGPASKRGVLVNITRGKDDLHAVSMALALAQHALEDGRSAVVFLNVAAPVFAAADLPQDVQYADFPPVGKMLADFMAAGGKVYACGHCSHVCGLQESDLIDGVIVAGHTNLFPELDDGAAVFSY